MIQPDTTISGTILIHFYKIKIFFNTSSWEFLLANQYMGEFIYFKMCHPPNGRVTITDSQLVDHQEQSSTAHHI